MNVAGAAVCVGDLDVALRVLGRAQAAVRGHGQLAVEAQILQARAWVLGCAGTHDEAGEVLRAARRLADRLGSPDLCATVDFDHGRLALEAADHTAADEHFARALGGEGQFSRPLARIWRAEALARLGRGDDAEVELRAAAAEPVTAGDWPDTLAARTTRVHGLIAAARGDRALARRRLRAAAEDWRRRARTPYPGVEAGERWAAMLTDIGRPVVGTVDPGAELAGILADLATMPLPAAGRR